MTAVAARPVVVIGATYGSWTVLEAKGGTRYLCRAECCGREQTRERYVILRSHEHCGQRSKNRHRTSADKRHAWLGNATFLRCKLPDCVKDGVVCGALVKVARATVHLWAVHGIAARGDGDLSQYFYPEAP